MDDTCIKTEHEPKKKSRTVFWICAGVVAACLALLFLTPNPLNPFHTEQEGCILLPTPTPAPEPSLQIRAFAGDNRVRNNATLLIKDTMYEWPWEYKIICAQYPCVRYNDITYYCRASYSGETLSQDWLGNKLADTIAQSTDNTIACELYEIKGITSDRFLAVKYADHDEYYVFMQTEYFPPATLGELITSLNLPETFPFTAFSVTDTGLKRYGITAEGSNLLWSYFSLTYAASPTLSNEPGPDSLPLGKTILSFTVDAEALGVSNLSWWLTSGGYLCTNIEDYGYYYYLGVDEVNELKRTALLHKTEAPEPDSYLLIGEIIDIKDNFIIVDDSIFMQNPSQGMQFMVTLDDIRMKRHLLCDRLCIGQHVQIRHSDPVKTDPTVITTAYELYSGQIHSLGNIAIKK